MGIQNVFDIKDPKPGDAAMHDGSGFKDGGPRFAFYDGKKWIFFAQDKEEPERQ